ncbi:hypothetical protein KC318_g3334 [Hortaea werneckii]|nr:hypothetical protein KC334_g4170 [Hortaea werneckii]KAI7671705.1 hypothetical protein KC318_g3334 [Hortaea werneckii]
MFEKAIKNVTTASLLGKTKSNQAQKSRNQSLPFSILQDCNGENDEEELVRSVQKMVVDQDEVSGSKLKPKPTPRALEVAKDLLITAEGLQTAGEPTLSQRPTPVSKSFAPWMSDWRKPDRRTIYERIAGATTIRTSTKNWTWKPGPRTKGGILHADLKEGTIVWHWDIRPCESDFIPDSDKRVFFKSDGSKWLKKGRYWLIVGRTEETLWEVPIYTNGNTGLSKVPGRNKSEYFSIRPKHVQSESFVNQSPTNEYVSVDWMTSGEDKLRGQRLRETMVAHFHEVFARDINEEPIRVVGAIRKEDTQAACEKVKPHLQK